jgi:hypothetical protein
MLKVDTFVFQKDLKHNLKKKKQIKDYIFSYTYCANKSQKAMRTFDKRILLIFFPPFH